MRDGTSPAKRDDATIPEDRRTGCPPSVLSCTAWGFSCLADCFASGELLPRLFTLTCASLPKNRRCLFCDTFRQPRLASGLPACFTRHAAVWCSDFPLRIASERSSAIAGIYHRAGIQKGGIWKPGNQEWKKAADDSERIPGFLVSRFSEFLLTIG